LRKDKIEQNFKLRLLALILALVLLWYSVNPAPYTPTRRESKDNQPDAEKRPPEPQARLAPPSLQFYRITGREKSVEEIVPEEDSDDFDWPEFIDG
jgi:hypothetical protein